MAFMASMAKPRHVPPRISHPVPRHVPPRIKPKRHLPVPSMAPELTQKQEKDSHLIGRWTKLLMQQYEDETSESRNGEMWYDNKGNPQQYQYEDESEGSHAYNGEMWYDSKGDPQQTSSHEFGNEQSDEYESIEEEEVQEFDKEAVIRTTKQVLQRHRSHGPKGKFGRRSRVKRGGDSAQAYRSRPRRGKKRPRHAICAHGWPNSDCAYTSIPDGKREHCQVPVSRLRYSQLSCRETFQCGHAVSELVRDLWYGKVKVSAPFLRLTVFERPDEKTGEPTLRCIDNRRLLALKEYAELLGEEDLLVHVNLYNMTTCNDFFRLIQNSDLTDGYCVRLRKKMNNKNFFF